VWQAVRKGTGQSYWLP